MAYQIREGQGSLFANEDKETERHPDYTGNVRLGGVLYRLAAWNRRAASGTEYLAISAKPERPRDDAATANSPAASPAEASQEFNDDIPF